MKRAVAEIAATLAKACRGAGLPLGTVEEVAMAAPWLSGDDLGALAALLETPSGRAVLNDLSATLDALACGARKVPLAAPPGLALAIAAGRGQAVRVTARGNLKPLAELPVARPPGPVSLDKAAWDRLEALAARTYVPATEASRRSGAGAGLIDND